MAKRRYRRLNPELEWFKAQRRAKNLQIQENIRKDAEFMDRMIEQRNRRVEREREHADEPR